MSNTNDNSNEYDNVPMEEIDSVNEKTFLHKIRSFLNSHQVHIAIIVLVIIDCLCVSFELLIYEYEKITNPKIDCPNSSTFKEHLNKTSGEHHELNHSHNFHLFLEVIEEILKYTSLTILSIFVLEILLKLILMPNIFVKSKWEIPDAIVVLLSFSLNIFLLFKQNEMESIAGLIALLR
jgi:hypothetical protein